MALLILNFSAEVESSKPHPPSLSHPGNKPGTYCTGGRKGRQPLRRFCRKEKSHFPTGVIFMYLITP